MQPKGAPSNPGPRGRRTLMVADSCCGVWLQIPVADCYQVLSFLIKTFSFQKSGDYLAIPITINVVLIISDTLLIWASGARNRILIWPWMIIHFLEFLFFIAALIFAMIIVPEPWFKVVQLFQHFFLKGREFESLSLTRENWSIITFPTNRRQSQRHKKSQNRKHIHFIKYFTFIKQVFQKSKDDYL